MRVLVTGATGFVGRFLVRALVAQGYDVTALVRASSPRERLQGLPVRLVVADLTQPRCLEGVMEGIDWVFHVAGDLSWWRGHRARQWAVNVEGTRRVVAEALRAGVKRLVYTSSVAAVGFPEDGRVADEDFPFNGHRLGLQYAISKWEAEQRVLEGVARGLDAVIVNPATILGDDAPRPGSLVDLAARGRLPVWVEGGTNFCDIDDVVAGHLAAAERGRTGQRYILGGHNVSFRDLIGALCRAAGVRPPRRRAPAAAVRLAAWVLEGVGAVMRREPLLTRDLARLAGKEIYYSSGRAVRELGYAITPLDQTVEKAVRRQAAAAAGRAA
ncbi:MAG TPA: NAD-dependent epimerase/dehydratase family protein [Limnochordales bacterium]